MSLSFSINQDGIQFDPFIGNKDHIIIHLYDMTVKIRHQDSIIIHSHIQSKFLVIVSFFCRHEIREKEARFDEIEEEFVVFDASMS